MNLDEFKTEVEKLGILVTQKELNELEKYYQLLVEYNKMMNLTSIIQKKAIYLKHFYDSLTILKIVDLKQEKTLCDIGTGAGFPGIVLKIFFPSLNIVLVDSLNKRINFLNIVIKSLGLTNIKAIHSRIEDFSLKNEEKFDIVVSRAVAQTNVLLELGIRCVRVNKYFIVMKGNLENEHDYKNSMLKLNCIENDLIRFKLPIEYSDRSLIKIKKLKSTFKLFPRKYSDIKRKPL